MRALIQRVSSAHIDIEGETVARIGTGVLALVAIQANDTPAQIERMANRIMN